MAIRNYWGQLKWLMVKYFFLNIYFHISSTKYSFVKDWKCHLLGSSLFLTHFLLAFVLLDSGDTTKRETGRVNQYDEYQANRKLYQLPMDFQLVSNGCCFVLLILFFIFFYSEDILWWAKTQVATLWLSKGTEKNFEVASRCFQLWSYVSLLNSVSLDTTLFSHLHLCFWQAVLFVIFPFFSLLLSSSLQKSPCFLSMYNYSLRNHLTLDNKILKTTSSL